MNLVDEVAVWNYASTSWKVMAIRFGLQNFIWNCNGSLRTDVGYFEDTLKNTDIAMYTETHQCMASKLPEVQGYRWESICRPQPRTRGSTRGSGGVAMLYKEELHGRVHVVHKDVDARYMWICIKRGDLRELYIAICYFPPAYSRFAPLGESPYLPLYDDIIRFATMGDIILLGDFNARTKDEQTTMFNTNEAVYGEVMAEEVGLKRQAQDMSAITEYGKHFRALGSAHGFVIYNGLSQWPRWEALTCWHPKGGACTIDYRMESTSLIP